MSIPSRVKFRAIAASSLSRQLSRMRPSTGRQKSIARMPALKMKTTAKSHARCARYQARRRNGEFICLASRRIGSDARRTGTRTGKPVVVPFRQASERREPVPKISLQHVEPPES